MSSSLGMPTAVPCARSEVASARRASQSRFGVRASHTASDSSCAPMPTPSSTHATTGPGTPGKRRVLRELPVGRARRVFIGWAWPLRSRRRRAPASRSETRAQTSTPAAYTPQIPAADAERGGAPIRAPPPPIARPPHGTSPAQATWNRLITRPRFDSSTIDWTSVWRLVITAK